MKIVALLFLLLALSGCVTLTPGEKAYMACLDKVPEDLNRAAEGEIDMYQSRTSVTLTKGDTITSPNSIASQSRCSPACQDAREERSRLASECYKEWQNANPSSTSSP